MADPRPLLLGEDPGRRSDPRLLLLHLPRGRAGHRLRELLGLSARRYLELDRANLFHRHPASWLAPSARSRAEELAPFLRGRLVLALGRRVAEALGVAGAPGATRVRSIGLLSPFVAVALPHPSGRNRALDDEEEAARTRALGRLALLACRGRRTDFRRLEDAPAPGETYSSLSAEHPADLLERAGIVVRGGGRLLGPLVVDGDVATVRVAVPEARSDALLFGARMAGWERGVARG